MKIQGRQSESDGDEYHMIRVRAIHSAYKSGACYCVTLLFDATRLVDHHCMCPAGARAFPCSHVSATLTALSRRQGEKPTRAGKRSRDEFAAHVFMHIYMN
ncbi:MAG: SWIM zinc finger family protein [Nitrosomonadaceae bacterium]